MSTVRFWSHESAMTGLRPLVGIWRHEPLMCKPGFYRVVFPEFGDFARAADAVMDDFGNLVRVQ